ncbi:hypothetical protein ACP70R_021393 [Stipagrostis hirtigluma subsp. patula]
MGDAAEPTRHCMHPPSHGYPPNEACPSPSWVLLDLQAFIADRVNATTASCVMSNGYQPAELAKGRYTTVEAAGDDLVLIRTVVPGSGGRTRCDNLVYQAGGNGPSLQLLPGSSPRPSVNYWQYSAGLLARRRSDNGEIGHFYVASLGYHDGEDPVLFLFDSMDGTWSSGPVPLGQQLRHRLREIAHFPCKVVELGEGGGGGALGFIDLWRGILICDVLGRRPARYVPLPPQLVRDDEFDGAPLLTRDVAVVDGRLTVARLQRRRRSWDVTTWSISSDPWEVDEEGWREDCTMHSRDISVDGDTDNAELLPTRPQDSDHNGAPQPALGRLCAAFPALSLSDHHVVHVMDEPAELFEAKASVLSGRLCLTRRDVRHRGVYTS